MEINIQKQDKIIIKNCDLDPDQGTYFINSSDKIFQEYVKKNRILFKKTDWISSYYEDDDGYGLEINSNNIYQEGLIWKETFLNCELYFNYDKKKLIIKSI